jgi:hypothetical protein
MFHNKFVSIFKRNTEKLRQEKPILLLPEEMSNNHTEGSGKVIFAGVRAPH